MRSWAEASAGGFTRTAGPSGSAVLRSGGAQLRAGEIRIGNQAVYHADFTPAWNLAPTAGTVALYHATEGQGGVLSDATMAAPNVNLQGTTAWTTTGPYCPAS